MKKITLIFACLLVSFASFAQVNIDLANAIQVVSLPYTDPAVNVPNGALEDGSVNCNFNVVSVDYKFEVVTGGTVTVTLGTPAGLSEPVLYYATTLSETNPTALTVTDNLGGVGASCFDNDAGADGVRTSVVNDGDIIFVLVANAGITDITFSGTAVLNSTLNVDDNSISKLNIYPNPVNDLLHITIPDSIEVTNLKLYDLLGRDTGLSIHNNTLNTNELSKGIYVLIIETEQGRRSIQVIKK